MSSSIDRLGPRVAEKRDWLLLLRSATRKDHRLTEDAFNLGEMVASETCYKARLGSIYRIYLALEPSLEGSQIWQETGLDFSNRQKLPLLIKDLIELDEIPADAMLGAPNLTSCPKALGCLYVLEGSTLGAQIIRKRVMADLGPDVPTRFFTGYGSATGRMWKGFGAALNRYCDEQGGMEEIIQAAISTFRFYRRGWLSPQRKEVAS
jgi:heme oxygenase